MGAVTAQDFSGCMRACRLGGFHTAKPGCEHAPPPEPTVSMSYTAVFPDGGVSTCFDVYTVEALTDLIAPAVGGRDLARAAAEAIIHRRSR